jgi:hypothetical protein
VTVLSGSDGSTVYSIYGASAGVLFGSSIAGIGDVDGDGVPDFVVGAPLEANALLHHGVVTAYSGSTGTAIYSVLGDASTDFLGWAIASMGDVDGDGFADFAVGTSTTSACVLSGKDGSTLWTLAAAKSTTFFGRSMCSGGDVDGDGIADVIVGDIYSGFTTPSGGSASVFSGANGA